MSDLLDDLMTITSRLNIIQLQGDTLHHQTKEKTLKIIKKKIKEFD